MGWPTCSPHDVSYQEKRRKKNEAGHTDRLMAKHAGMAFFEYMHGWTIRWLMVRLVNADVQWSRTYAL